MVIIGCIKYYIVWIYIMANGNNSHIKFSTMTLKEEYNLNGCLSEETILNLIDKESDGLVKEDYEETLTYRGCIEEASSSLVGEDLLDGLADLVRELNVRGDNLEVKNTLIFRIEQIQDDINKAMEYAHDEMGKTIKHMKEMEEKHF